ncbi:MAG: hypothetical protein NZV14_10410 [Bryobacteraceae bacterium]|nr:hypothetical protein [Bryobacteraceae bacterium]MDW8378565.1 hypothetical protein [Bryobacterales bacterium]
MIQPSTFNITTLCMLGLTAWIFWMRHRTPLENNWPLFYYVALVVYSKKFEDAIDPTVLLLTVVMALLLRFEFLGPRALAVIKVFESLGLIYVMVRCFSLVYG